MENKLFVLLVLICYACGNTTPSTQDKQKPYIHATQNDEKKQENQEKTKSGRFIFISYNDDGDYTLLNVRQKGGELQFVNDLNEKRDLLRGDIIEIKWKQDSVIMAGDGNSPFPAEVLLSVKKIKDGAVSGFRKRHKAPISYHWSPEYNYSKSYLDRLYLIAEYYIVHSTNRLLIGLIKENAGLSYSVEQQKRNNTEYTVLGIGSSEDHHNVTVQWLFFDPEKRLLYEYDLPNDELHYFDTVP